MMGLPGKLSSFSACAILFQNVCQDLSSANISSTRCSYCSSYAAHSQLWQCSLLGVSVVGWHETLSSGEDINVICFSPSRSTSFDVANCKPLHALQVGCWVEDVSAHAVMHVCEVRRNISCTPPVLLVSIDCWSATIDMLSCSSSRLPWTLYASKALRDNITDIDAIEGPQKPPISIALPETRACKTHVYLASIAGGLPGVPDRPQGGCSGRKEGSGGADRGRCGSCCRA